MELIILAAGQGKRVNKYLKKNKCLLKIRNNKTLIEKIIDDFTSLINLDKISVVIGYNGSKIRSQLINYKINFIYNKDYKKKEMLHSLYLGLLKTKKDAIVVYSDIYFAKSIIMLIRKNASKNIILPINLNWKSVWKKRKKDFFEDCETLTYNKKFYLSEIGNKIISKKKVMGQYMGIIYFPKKSISKILKIYKEKTFYEKTHITQFLNNLLKKNIKIKCLPCKSNWYEFDDIQDIRNFQK